MYNTAYIRDPDDWNDWFNEWYEQMTNAMIDANESYALGTVDIGYAANQQLGTVTDPNFKFVKRLWMTNDGIGFVRATPTDMNSYMPDQTFNAANPYFTMMNNNVISRMPYESPGTARLVYQKQYSPLVNDTDELPSVMRDYTKSFVDYMQAQALNKDGKNGDAKEQEAISEMNQFKVQVAPQTRLGVQTILIQEDTGEFAEAW
jgi:hypothetical protein